MIDLYAAGTSNGMRARIALEECGLPYTLHFVDLTKGAADTSGVARVIYFDFDSYVVKDEYRGIIDRYAKALAAEGCRVAISGRREEVVSIIWAPASRRPCFSI